MNDGNVYLHAEDAFYSADGPQASVIYVVSEGDILARAYLYEGTSRYTNTEDITGNTVLWRDFELCLRDQLRGFSEPELTELFSEGFNV